MAPAQPPRSVAGADTDAGADAGAERETQQRVALAKHTTAQLKAAADTAAAGAPVDAKLRALVADLAGEVAPSARQALGLDGRAAASAAAAPRFYTPVADVVASCPALSAELCGVVAALRAHAFAAPALALCLHGWVFAPSSPREGAAVPQPVLACVHRGMRELFAMDLDSAADRFAAVHAVAWDSLGARSGAGALAATSPAQRREALATLAAYSLYYGREDTPGQLADALGALPDAVGRVADAEEDAATLLAEAAAQLLETVAVTPALLRVLAAVRKRLPAHVSKADGDARLRLERVLYRLSTPGGPRAPCGEVRQAARRALDALAPVGSRGRWAVSSALNVLARPHHLPDIVGKRLFRGVAWALTWPAHVLGALSPAA